MIPMRQLNVLAATLGVAVASLSCGSVVRNGSSPMFLVINALGGGTGTVNPVFSNVQNIGIASPPCPAPPTQAAPSCTFIVSDGGAVALALVAKNQSSVAAPSSSNNEVTINRYHVAFTRADGLNTPGVDVPYPFDGAVTGTVQVGGGALSLTFELVPIVAKEEPPLAALVNSQTVLLTIASVTFYGQDLVGNAISATGTIQVDFGNFGLVPQ